MDVYGGKEMAAAFRTVRNNTITIAEEIPEDRYSFRATPETRTIGQLLTHIALITNVPMHIHGNKINDLKQVNFPQLMKEAGTLEMMPRSKADIIMLLKSERDKFAAFLEGTTNGFLAEGVATPNPDQPSRSRFEMLLSAKEHEMHHRAQLMMMQRMIGITPHLTLQMQERMARAQQGQQQAPSGR